MNIEKKGFTMVEILVVIAIVGILAAVVFIGLSRHRTSARTTKTFASLSSVIPSMASCWSFGGEVNGPHDDGQICTLSSSYGLWPAISGDNYGYSDSNYGFLPDGFQPKKPSNSFTSFLIPPAEAMAVMHLSKTNWFYSAQNTVDSTKICCNQKMNACKVISISTACDNTIN